jgi:hypothetical protein
LAKHSPVFNKKIKDHCIAVYNFLQKNNEPEEVCNAGLYNLIYGILDDNIIENTRTIIINEIGSYAENLVYEICSLPDREKNIFNGEFNWDSKNLINILKISRANLIVSSIDNDSAEKKFQIYQYDLLLNYALNKINPFKLQNLTKNQIKIFDNFFSYSYLSGLYDYVKKSQYSLGHVSNFLGKTPSNLTSRFACYLSKQDIFDMGLCMHLEKIAKQLGRDLFLNIFYIGHFDSSTCSDFHVDTTESSEDLFTIIIYPNTFWDDLWAGDLKFYDDNSVFNKTIDFVPGRIIVFDSRIKHKVMPVSKIADDSRFSIAIKGCYYSGLHNYITNRNMFEEEDILHISCT